MKKLIRLDTKQMSHYLRSKLVSVHSAISHALLISTQDEVKIDLSLAREEYLVKALSRIDLLYYSLLDKAVLQKVMPNYPPMAYLNIVHNLDSAVHAQLAFLFKQLDCLVEKLEITATSKTCHCFFTIPDDDDNLFTVTLFCTCFEKLIATKKTTITKTSSGYNVDFSYSSITKP